MNPISRWNQVSGLGELTFEAICLRLVQQVKQRINNGEFTERGLARILGISQSQAHNVLKGARRLKMQLADQILTKLGLSVMDLLSEGELDAALRAKMAEWDRELAAAESGFKETGLDWVDPPEMRKPAARAAARTAGAEQKTG